MKETTNMATVDKHGRRLSSFAWLFCLPAWMAAAAGVFYYQVGLQS